MAAPAITNRTVGDLVQEVVEALQERTDVSDIAPKYIKRAVQEITRNFPFEELRRTGPTVTLTAGLPIYPVYLFLNPNHDYSSPESFGIYVDPPNNTVVSNIRFKTVKAIEPMIAPATQGLPSHFTRFGPNFHFGPNPNNTYAVFLRYQVKHPWPEDTSTTSLSGARLYYDDDWDDIVVYAAAERIAIVKRWNDQAKVCHDILFGDPEYATSQGKMGRPGLLSARIAQQERDEKFDTRQLSIINPRYNVR